METIKINIFTPSSVKRVENMRGIDLLPIEKENKARLKEFALQYKKFARIIVEVVSVVNNRIIVRVEQKEAVNDKFLSKKELEDRVRDMFSGEIPDTCKLTISAVDFDRRDIEAINIDWIIEKMEKLNLKQKDLGSHLGIDKSSLSLIFGEQRELTKWQKACFYYFFKYYGQSNFK
jgi:antitoxin component HigA of HigAB toxin-antitoxin module